LPGTSKKERLMNASQIREHMEILGSCGNRLGAVDYVEGHSIKMTRNSSENCNSAVGRANVLILIVSSTTM
jgi:Uncharacterized protein conserved in bacteria (DUF2171)